jgi:hypothetical protein
VAGAITVMSGAIVSANTLLLSINASRRKAKLENAKATATELKAINAMCVELAKNLGFKSLTELHAHTGDPEVSLKLLMAHQRRMSVLIEYAEQHKAILTLPTESSSNK